MKVRLTTIKDIAHRLGISHSTVSRALSNKAAHLVSEKTRMLVRQTAEEMQYTPNLMAQGFVTGKTGTLGLLTSQDSFRTCGAQIEQMLKAAEEAHYRLLISMVPDGISRSSQSDQSMQIRQLISRGVDGLLVATLGDREESDRICGLVRNHVPVVTYNNPADQLSGVVVDFEADFHMATNHLITLGHRKIAFIGRKLESDTRVSSKGRGYAKAMREHGMPYEIMSPTGTRVEGGYIQGRNLRNRFTALLCRDDTTAIGVCRGLRDAGFRIPADVAVIGYGDLEVSAYLSPALTTMAVPYEEIARTAMDLMLRQIGGEDKVEQVTLRSRLIERESSDGSGGQIRSSGGTN